MKTTTQSESAAILYLQRAEKYKATVPVIGPLNKLTMQVLAKIYSKQK